MDRKRPGYEYLSAYMLGKVIQDLTVQFCNRFVKNPKYPNFPNRQIDQMVQAARSNSQNVAEGYSNPSLKAYIKLSGIAYGSNEELTKDYQDYLRQHNMQIWGKDHPKIRGFRAFRAKWITATTQNTPKLPNDPEEATNMLLTFCNMDGFLLKKLEKSLEEKHEKEGGLTERLYSKRISYRRSH